VGAGARMSKVVLGPGARVGAGVQLDRTVVWPVALASESLRDAVVAPYAVVLVER